MQALRSTQVCGVSDRLQKCPDVVTGRPDVDVNMGDLKPTWLAVGIAVVALSQCLPVGGSKTFGSYAINSPFKAVAKGEVRSSLQKNEGNATLRLGVGQLNAFVRF